jgi:rubrerythrin
VLFLKRAVWFPSLGLEKLTSKKIIRLLLFWSCLVHIQNLFKPLEDVERNLSILYKQFSERFCDDPEARVTFYRLYLDEKAHLALVQYQKRLVKQNPKLFGEIDLDLGEVVLLAARVDEMLWTKRDWELPEALTLSLTFEQSAAEYHYRTALKLANPGMASLARNLGGGDETHLVFLKDLVARRGAAVPAKSVPATGGPQIP